jgi:iron complex transport system ATP-binding protein
MLGRAPRLAARQHGDMKILFVCLGNICRSPTAEGVVRDIAGREFLLNTIAELASTHPELTIIFITQRIEDILPEFNRGMILRQGEIQAYGSRDEVLTEQNLKAAFNLDIRLIRARNGRLWSVIE